jgi:serine/threonine protein kinase/Tfp pilus assembly protein PilF
VSDGVTREELSLDSLVAELADDFLNRRARGECPNIEDYVARYPDFGSVLREVLSALQLCDLVSGPGQRVDDTGLEPPGCLGDFRIVREVGRGGMGVVYEARQLSLDRRVALKVLPFAAALDPRHLQRFKTETRAAARLHHTNIVPIFGVGCERGVHFYAMQFIDGRTLTEVIGDFARNCDAALEGPVPDRPSSGAGSATRNTRQLDGRTVERTPRGREFFRLAARLGVQAADALEHAHQEGIVHRDIKPANLLVDGKGNLWVTDFGLARLRSDAALTMTGDIVGTLRYMSPEQALGSSAAVDHRTDIYSLGATLYELLTGQPVFGSGDRQELLRQIATDDPRSPRLLNRSVPPELEVIVLKALEKEIGCRYASARELADDLRCFLDDKPIRARRPSRWERARKWARRHRPWVRSATMALLVGLTLQAGSIGWILRDRSAHQAKAVAELAASLNEVQESRKSGAWERARSAAKRVSELLADGVGGTEIAESGQRILDDLAQEEADRRLLEGIERIRFIQFEPDVKQNRFVLMNGYPVYREVFGAYGWHPESTEPQDAAASLRRQPEAVRGPTVGALDHWLILARAKKAAAEAAWLEKVIAAGDPDPWRRDVREARKHNDRKALERLAREVDITAQPSEELFLLQISLQQRGAGRIGLLLLLRAHNAFPADFWINQELGALLMDSSQPPQSEAAVRFLTAAVALRPNNAGVQFNLGRALYFANHLNAAADAMGRAITLRPDYAAAHWGLGTVLIAQGFADQGCLELRKSVKLQPDVAWCQYELGKALAENGQLPDAVAAYRRAIELQPDNVEAYCNLGIALERQAKFAEALAVLERGHELEAMRPRSKNMTAKWLRDCKRIIELEHKLPELVSGQLQPVDIEDRASFINACHFTKCFAASARLRAQVLADKSIPADKLPLFYRYNAACAAALAGCGLGVDCGQTTDEDRARLRRQALEWLRADLQDYAKLLDGQKPMDIRFVRKRLRNWQNDPDLNGLRDSVAQARLADDECQACKQLWNEVESLLGRTAADF